MSRRTGLATGLVVSALVATAVVAPPELAADTADDVDARLLPPAGAPPSSPSSPSSPLDGSSPLDRSPPLDRSTAARIALAHVTGRGEPSEGPPGQWVPGRDHPLGRTADETSDRRSTLSADDLVVTAVVQSDHNGLSNVHLQQRVRGIDVRGAVANVAVAAGGEVVFAPSSVSPDADVPGGAAVPTIGVVEAAARGAAHLDLEITRPFAVRRSLGDAAHTTELSDGGATRATVPARLVWEPSGGKDLRLAWELEFDVDASHEWWRIRIDAETGEELSRFDLVVHEPAIGAGHDHEDPLGNAGAVDGTWPSTAVAASPVERSAQPGDTGAHLVADGSSYRVIPAPFESPNHSPLAVVDTPAHDVASPFGWHDLDGVVGAETTLTLGNNVAAGTDLNSDDVLDGAGLPSGGPGLDFDFAADFGADPSTYRDAAVTNAFYWSNVAHDVLYAYGFDEEAGNFQVNNYGRGGRGGDAVIVDVQDGAGGPNPPLNNANFTTPPDGSEPRMQLYLFGGTEPERDGAFDASVVTHEYVHGLTTRLTGGPAYDECLDNDEQMGEGWSDVVALLLTMEGTDASDIVRTRGIGTYALGEPPSGDGVRGLPYSDDEAINPWSYDSIRRASIPHGVGAVWAQMLWEMTLALVDRYGFDPDLYEGTGGNNVAMQLIVDGLKLQACSPGFVDGRDAILQADAITNDGANTCLIWRAFAERGLGVGADQGSGSSRSDGVEDFGLPTSCLVVGIDAPAEVGPDEVIEYTVTARNNSDELGAPTVETDVELATGIPTGATYVSGSGDCGAALLDDVVRQPIGDLAAGAVATCSFRVRTPSSPVGRRLFDDPFVVDLLNWTVAGSGDAAWFWDGVPTSVTPPSVADQRLELSRAVPIGATTTLSFLSAHDFEVDVLGATDHDGGVVEVSTDGGATWIDLGPYMTAHGYTGTIASGYGNPLAGRGAFTGERSGVRTEVDLGTFAGTSATIRFRVGSDESVGNGFWMIDDVRLTDDEVRLEAETTITSDSATFSATASTRLVEEFPPAVVSALTPARLLDTRPGAETFDGEGRGGGPIAAGSTTVVQVAGRGGVPKDASAAVVNVTAIQPESLGFITLFPCTATVPTASSLNVAAGVNLGNEVVAELDAQGRICLFSSSRTDLAIDVNAYVPTDSAYGPVPPARLVDSRATGTTIDDRFAAIGRRSAGTELRVPVAGRAGVPGDAGSVVVNVTAVQPGGVGFVTVHACESVRPTVSSLNFAPSTNRGNEIVAELDASGAFCVFTSEATDLTVDVVGHLPGGTSVRSVDPSRLLDTRPDGATIDGRAQRGGVVAADETVVLPIGARAAVPEGASAAVVNITAVQPSGIGFVTAFPCGTKPTASSLNYEAGVNGGNDVIVALGAGGELCLYTSNAIHLTVDVTGFIEPR